MSFARIGAFGRARGGRPTAFMPELRQNLATKEWVIIATERAQRPGDLAGGEKRSKPGAPERDPECPFCPGNESRSESAEAGGGAPGWKVRAVKNRYPALVEGAPKVEPMGKLYRRLPGEGVHEVIVESPSHRLSLADQDHAQLERILAAYQARFQATAENMKVALTMLFKNHGAGSGASLEHPHTQIIGSSVVPSHIRHRMDEAQRHFEQNNECVFCRMNEEELAQKVRVVSDTEHFLAYVLFAALSPFHIWIVPKRHEPSFHELTDAERGDLARVLKSVLSRLKSALGDPDYNFVVQSVPQDRGVTSAFHWYLSLVVRLGRSAGFELGSGMHINTVAPEEAARFLNAAGA